MQQPPAPLPILAFAIVVSILLGLVSVPMAHVWQRNHNDAESQRALDDALADLDKVVNDLKLGGGGYKPTPYVRQPAPLPARSPWATGLAVTLGVFVLFGAGSALRRR